MTDAGKAGFRATKLLMKNPSDSKSFVMMQIKW